MDSNSNRGMTVLIILAVVIILGVRFFLSNRDVVTEEDVRDKIDWAIAATRTAQVSMPTEAVAANMFRLTLTAADGLNAIEAQETYAALLASTLISPTAIFTEVDASSGLRVQRTADALRMTIAAQETQIADLQATNKAFAVTATPIPTRTPIPTIVDVAATQATPNPVRTDENSSE